MFRRPPAQMQLGRSQEMSGAMGRDQHEQVVRPVSREPDAATHKESHFCTSRRDGLVDSVGFVRLQFVHSE